MGIGNRVIIRCFLPGQRVRNKPALNDVRVI
jgi:hypothetical protein